jgi:hypothetical protein
MKIKYALAVLLLACRAAWCQDLLREYKCDIDGAPSGVSTAEVDGRQVVKIENTNDAPLQVTLLTITKPPITTQVYELTGEIRYDGVKGDGYLEMWNYFPPIKPGLPEGQYFSRTLGDDGPMGKISGTSGWRAFTLPFDSTGATGSPTHLQMNLILKGPGTVYISKVKLIQMPKAKSASNLVYPNAWWSMPESNTIFGWGGAIIGCLCGLCAWLAAKGKGRRFVMAVMIAFTCLGAGMALGGLAALGFGQPYFVWLPMIVVAIVLLGISPTSLKRFSRRYEEIELRRMVSLDASS